MKKGLVFILMIQIYSNVFGQYEVNYKPQLFVKEIQNISETENFSLTEIQALSSNENGKYFIIETNLHMLYGYIGRVNTCRTDGCNVNTSKKTNMTYEFLDYFIVFDSLGKILSVRVFNYASTHGQEITVKSWLNQFKGYDGNYELIIGKHINAISGATTSVYGITNDIMLRTSILKNYINKDLYKEIIGITQGTNYKIIYKNNAQINVSTFINNIFKHVDTTFSIYNPNSIVYKINHNEINIILNNLFYETFQKAYEISVKTEGAFDITANKNHEFSYTSIAIINNGLQKQDSSITLDFNAIAQGVTVDLISDYFLENGITNFLIEIGGEIRCNGVNSNNENWKIGIDSPNSIETLERSIEDEIIRISGKSVATSGNYRRAGHIINPKTGKSIENEILSVTIIADSCYLADCYATAFVVMGLEKCKKFLQENTNIQAFIIYKDSNGNIKHYSNFNF